MGACHGELFEAKLTRHVSFDGPPFGEALK